MKLKSFKIAKIKKTVNYELVLLKEVRIHSVFHIFLLESADLSESCRASHADMMTKISIVRSHMSKQAVYYIEARTSRARLTALGSPR